MTVMIRGERGTGKDVVATGIEPRRHSCFISRGTNYTGS
jgi:DNA-binding NtrC family response regulator